MILTNSSYDNNTEGIIISCSRVHEKLLETAAADTSDVPGKEYSTLIEMLLNLPIFVLLLSTICSNNRSYVSTISP